MTDPASRRAVAISRVGAGRFRATNAQGATLDFGADSATGFTPVELFLASIGGCSAIDVDTLTSRRAEPESFDVEVAGDKVKDPAGNRMTSLSLTFRVTFPGDAAGEAARAILPDAVQKSHDRLCVVSRTVEMGAPLDVHIVD